MAEVYFSQRIEKILDAIDFQKLSPPVAIKVHFGEKGCTTYLDPEIARKIYRKLDKLGKRATLVECNVLYKGSRTNSIDHIRTAREHGFDLPIDILDGHNGDDSINVNGCMLGKGISQYGSLIVLSHFKGHIAAGFGGAIKNIGMGLASRPGKLYMHANVSPIIGENCTACGACVEKCKAEAIKIKSGKASIDKSRCEGCAMCIAVCPSNAVLVPWGARTSEALLKKIVEYASAVKSLYHEIVYINVLQNITKECDCMDIIQTPIMPDIGFVYSKDMVAADKASLDLINAHSGKKFMEINDIDKQMQLRIAEESGLGDLKYSLTKI